MATLAIDYLATGNHVSNKGIATPGNSIGGIDGGSGNTGRTTTGTCWQLDQQQHLIVSVWRRL